jgi:hypothetical protein
MLKPVPSDIVLQVFQFAVWKSTTCPRTQQLELTKRHFHQGLANACKSYRRMYMFEWFRALTLYQVEDWEYTMDHGFANHVR